MEPTPRVRIKTAPKDRTLYQNYTLTHWGDTPYPSLVSPTPRQAEEVYKRLMAAHGDRLRPAHITAPSLDVAGCGEVPQVLDAIIRTILSSNTTFKSADAALQGLRKAAGTISDKQNLNDADRPKLEYCLDYMFILTNMDRQQLASAIKPAGSQLKKADWILDILADVRAINKERTDAFREEISDVGKPADPAKILAAGNLLTQEKQWEIQLFEKGILNLEFLKKLAAEDAMNKMLGWEGIGVKTAACVLLFCMQKDILACDTHCIRLSKWLGWAPVEATDNLVFAHIDNRVPDKLKYSLHQLFIQHGKDCFRCQDKTSESTAGWDATFCPLDDLIDRGSLTAYKIAQATKSKSKHKAKETTAQDAKSENAKEEQKEEKDKQEDKEDLAENLGEGDEGASVTEKKKSFAQRKAQDEADAGETNGKSKCPQTKDVGQGIVGNIKMTWKVDKANIDKDAVKDKANTQPKHEPEVAAVAAYDGPITRKRALDALSDRRDTEKENDEPWKRPRQHTKGTADRQIKDEPDAQYIAARDKPVIKKQARKAVNNINETNKAVIKRPNRLGKQSPAPAPPTTRRTRAQTRLEA
ncbi:unnamed protein product [Discula destructiva]